MEIEPGALLDARTASGSLVRVRAVSKPQRGRDFPVVWVCTESEYARALGVSEEPDALPWPLDAVTVAEPIEV